MKESTFVLNLIFGVYMRLIKESRLLSLKYIVAYF